jgi:hypothetical protein
MARKLRSLYQWRGVPGEGSLERTGWISEAKLRAWEYSADSDTRWEYRSDSFRDTVRPWRTARPDLSEPERILVGDYEETSATPDTR